jgi:hypothetical protein
MAEARDKGASNFEILHRRVRRIKRSIATSLERMKHTREVIGSKGGAGNQLHQMAENGVVYNTIR